LICIFPSRTIHQLGKSVPETLHGALRLIHGLLLVLYLLWSRLLQLLLYLHLQLFHHLRVLPRRALSPLVRSLVLLLGGWSLQGFDSWGLLTSLLHGGDVPLGHLLRVYFLCEMLGQDGGDIAWLARGWLHRAVEGERGAFFLELRVGGRRRYKISSSSSLFLQSKLKHCLVHLHVSTLLIEITDIFEHTFALFIICLLFLI